MALRKAQSNTKQIDLGDNDYLTVITDISKRDFNTLIAAMPQDVDTEKGLTPHQGTQFQTALFETLVRGWSLDGPVNREEYLSLDTVSAAKVDEALVAHYGSLQPDAPKDEQPETSPGNSRKGGVKTTN